MLKKSDVALIVVLMVSSVILFGWVVFAQEKKGTLVRIQVDGRVVGTFPLNQPREVPIHEDGVDNVIQIEDGTIRMMHSNCPDQYCVKQGAIDKVNQSIVCLPNCVAVTIEGDEDAPVDVYVQ